MADQPPHLFFGIVTFGGVSYMVWGTRNRFGHYNYGQRYGLVIHNGTSYAVVGIPMDQDDGDGDGGDGDGGGGDGDGGDGGGGEEVATAEMTKIVAPAVTSAAAASTSAATCGDGNAATATRAETGPR